MNIAVKSTTEQRAGYVFASLTIQLAGMTLGDKNAEDLCGTVTAGLQTVTHNICGLIRDPHVIPCWEQAKKHPLEEYTGTVHDLLPRGTNIFDGDTLLVFRDGTTFTALCEPYNHPAQVLSHFPLETYVERIIEAERALSSR